MLRCLAATLVVGCCSIALADVPSGPAVGAEVPELTVFGVTGDVQNEEADFAEHRGDRPTIYCFIPDDKWSRPAARLIKTLDGQITDVDEEADIVVVWLTEDPDEAKEYLPRAQQSLRLEHTSLTVCTSDPLGPLDWAVNLDAEVTAIVAVDGEIKKTFGFVSVNETVADDVIEAFE